MHLAGQRPKRKKEIFKKLLMGFLSILFPERCPVCDEILEPELLRKKRVHSKCEKKLIPVGNVVCIHCGRPVNEEMEYCYDCRRKSGVLSFVQGKSLFVYQGAIRKTMYRFKYSNKREYAAYFAEEAVRLHGDWIRKNGIEIIVPVPMYAPKRRRRGYNQAECFGKALSEKLNLPMEKDWVKRVKDTAPQKELDDIQRKNNLKSAFLCDENIVQCTKVLLVDDIYTTGSTADAVTEELLKAGVKEVYFLSVCIGKGI